MVASVSEEIAEFLDSNYKWDEYQPVEAVPPVLVILNYAPDNSMEPVSIAFDLTGGPKCWLSKNSVRSINGHCPAYHLNYRKFEYERVTFHPYSVQPFESGIFSKCTNLIDACNQLHAHAVPDEGTSK